MTKKDYIIIANVLRILRYNEAYCFDNADDYKNILLAFEKEFRDDNQRFDSKKFRMIADYHYQD